MSRAVFCAESALDRTLKEREEFLCAAKKDYEKKISEINAATCEKLSTVLRKSIAAKDFKQADGAGKAIIAIQNAPSSESEAPELKQSAAGTGKKVEGAHHSIAKTSIDGSYPEGTFRKFGHHYSLFPFKMNYYDAVKTCESLGGHVLNVGDAEEYAFFMDLSRKESKPLWLDLHRKTTDGEWIDWKNEKASYIKWFDGTYGENKESVCIAINVNNSGSDMVRINGLKFANYVICEWEK